MSDTEGEDEEGRGGGGDRGGQGTGGRSGGASRLKYQLSPQLS